MTLLGSTSIDSMTTWSSSRGAIWMRRTSGRAVKRRVTGAPAGGDARLTSVGPTPHPTRMLRLLLDRDRSAHVHHHQGVRQSRDGDDARRMVVAFEDRVGRSVRTAGEAAVGSEEGARTAPSSTFRTLRDLGKAALSRATADESLPAGPLCTTVHSLRNPWHGRGFPRRRGRILPLDVMRSHHHFRTVGAGRRLL